MARDNQNQKAHTPFASNPTGTRKRPFSPARPLIRKFSPFKKPISLCHTSIPAVSIKNKKPRRPLGAYNLFFRHERENIINGTTSTLASLVLSGKEYNSEDLLREILSDGAASAHNSSYRPPNPGDASKRAGGGGAKRHAELTRIISSKWRALDAPSRAIYDGLALLERKKYKQEMERWAEVERIRKQQDEGFVPLSRSEESGESCSTHIDDEDAEMSGDDKAKEKCLVAVPILPSKSASTASGMRGKLPEKDAPKNSLTASLRPQTTPELKTFNTEKTLTSPLSALRTSIIERKHELQRDAERRYRLAHAVSCFRSASGQRSREGGTISAQTSTTAGDCKQRQEEFLAGGEIMVSVESPRPILSAEGGMSSTTDSLDADDWTEGDATMIFESTPSDVENEEGINDCFFDISQDNDEEMMYAELYAPTPINSANLAMAAINVGMHDSIPSLHSSNSSLNWDNGVGQSEVRDMAGGTKDGSIFVDEDEMDEESVRFLASIFCVRSAVEI